MLSKELLNELRIIFEEDFGINLTSEEVAEVASLLIGYFDMLGTINYQN